MLFLKAFDPKTLMYNKNEICIHAHKTQKKHDLYTLVSTHIHYNLLHILLCIFKPVKFLCFVSIFRNLNENKYTSSLMSMTKYFWVKLIFISN